MESFWRCVGKIGMVDIICFLARDESLADQAAALRTPVSSIVSDTAFAIQHVDSRSKCVQIPSFTGLLCYLLHSPFVFSTLI